MWKLIRKISARLPRRRRRLWRYISPQRRGAGLVLLTVLLTGVYGYWYLTNDGRIRRQARRYLQNLTGGRVDIDHADFSLFGGIELRGVRVHLPASRSPEHFFVARTVFLRYSPWGLLATGRIQSTEIICIEPVVSLDYDAESGLYPALRHFASIGPEGLRPGFGEAGLPPIRVVRGLLRRVEVVGGLRRVAAEKHLNVLMSPVSQMQYRVDFEERPAEKPSRSRGSLVFSVATGKISQESGTLWSDVGELLPAKYAHWLRRYGIKGSFDFSSRTDPQTKRKLFHVVLKDFSMKLPASEGDLDLLNVCGRLTFDERGVSLSEITGRIRQAGAATFQMEGRYDGYEPDSPFAVDIHIKAMELPRSISAAGQLARTLRKLHEQYSPTGRLDLAATFQRLTGGETRFTGTAALDGMTMTFKYFPYRLENVTGSIVFLPDRAKLRDLTASRGKSRFTVGGYLDLNDDGAYDITVRGREVSLDEQLYRALPEKSRRVWRAFSPAGTASAVVNVRRRAAGKQQHVDVTVVMDGRMSMKYSGFPYPLEGVTGQLHFVGDSVQIPRLDARNGSMRCTIRGSAAFLETDQPQVDLQIDAWRVPIDAQLASALGRSGGGVLGWLDVSGTIERVRAVLKQPRGKDLDYTINVTFNERDEVGWKFDAFPYAVSSAAGTVTIRPRRIIVEALRGRGANSDIVVSGQVFTARRPVGLDLNVRAEGIGLDRALFDALPAHVKGLWRRFSPVGQADVSFAIRRNVPDLPDKTDYECIIDAKDMQFTYCDLPYVFRNVRGRIVASPGRIVLKGIEARSGKMAVALDGTIATGSAGDRAELSVRATDVEIDAKLIGALGGGFGPIVGRLKPGGSCDIDLSRLTLVGAAAPASRPATAAASRPDQPHAAVCWNAGGSVTFYDAVLDIGFGPKKVSGTLSGSVGRLREGLAIDAKIALDSVSIAKQKITSLGGHIVKSSASPLIHFKDLLGRAYGGNLYGAAEVRLAKPMQYGMRLTVKDIDLQKLFTAAVAAGQKIREDGEKAKVKGLLSGTVELRGTAGRNATRQAAGQLRISKAKLYKLPVLLGLLHVVYLSLPSDAAFTEGEISYHLRGEKLIFREIYLSGSVVSLLGSGTMNVRNEKLKLTFLVGPPGKLPRIRSLANELLAGIAREIVEIRVTGTLARPKKTTVALRSLDQVIHRLLAPGQAGG